MRIKHSLTSVGSLLFRWTFLKSSQIALLIAFVFWSLAIFANDSKNCDEHLTRFIGSDKNTYQIYVHDHFYNHTFDVRSYLSPKGLLHLYIITRNKNGALITPLSGKDIFTEIMSFYNTRVNGIVANWGWGTNLEKFNQLTAQGVSLYEAAQLTWTGKRASEYGMTDVEFVELHGSWGHFQSVRVLFTKKETSFKLKDLSREELESIDWFHES